MISRDEHLEWCKKRALLYVDHGDLANAIASMGSDLRKHEDFKDMDDVLMALGMFYAVNNDVPGIRRWIEGFR